jgi:hypothetical protein
MGFSGDFDVIPHPPPPLAPQFDRHVANPRNTAGFMPPKAQRWESWVKLEFFALPKIAEKRTPPPNSRRERRRAIGCSTSLAVSGPMLNRHHPHGSHRSPYSGGRAAADCGPSRSRVLKHPPGAVIKLPPRPAFPPRAWRVRSGAAARSPLARPAHATCGRAASPAQQ